MIKIPGRNQLRNKMRLLQAQRSGDDVFLDTAGYLRAARPINQGEIIELPKVPTI